MASFAVVIHSVYQTLAGAFVGSAIDLIFPKFNKKEDSLQLVAELLTQGSMTALALYKVASAVKYKIDDSLGGTMFFIAGYEVQDGFKLRLEEFGKQMKCALKSMV